MGRSVADGEQCTEMKLSKDAIARAREELFDDEWGEIDSGILEFLNAQVELDADSAAVLNDNLWDLYGVGDK